MRIDIISAIPGILHEPLNESIIKRARSSGLAEIIVHDLREFAKGNYRQVDDKPFGGGGGMVLKPEPFFECIEILLKEREYEYIIHLTPQGDTFTQSIANKLSLCNNIMLLCGHYKGIDQRVIDTFVNMELSIGNFVLTGGEIAALAIADAVIRLIPNVIGNSESLLSDTYQTAGLFDAPQYTRPAVFRDMKVPDVLINGNHMEINKWRTEQGRLKHDKQVKKRKNK
jgi:tRNA (guanine37-N1)-methyltransferase